MVQLWSCYCKEQIQHWVYCQWTVSHLYGQGHLYIQSLQYFSNKVDCFIKCIFVAPLLCNAVIYLQLGNVCQLGLAQQIGVNQSVVLKPNSNETEHILVTMVDTKTLFQEEQLVNLKKYLFKFFLKSITQVAYMAGGEDQCLTDIDFLETGEIGLKELGVFPPSNVVSVSNEFLLFFEVWIVLIYWPQ